MKPDYKKIKIRHYILLALSVILLFFLNNNNYKINQLKRINSISKANIINTETTSSKGLFLESWQVIKTNYYNRNLNSQNWYKWKKRYANKIKTDEDAYVAINTMLASLDDSYSKFMSEGEFREQNNAINSRLYGIGINIASISGKIYIVNVLKDAPAYAAGIRPGDIILKVNDNDVNGASLYHTAQLIKGEENESIELELLRGTEKFKKSTKREEINVKTIEYKKITDEIGYIRISSFIGADTPKEFIIALNKLQNPKGLILDLRGNAGGLFQNAVIISNFFLDKGNIVQVVARQGKKNIYTAKPEGCIYKNPVVVLVDGSTASASEIVASALKDNNRAILVGSRTYGKGLVQKIFPLYNKTGMNLTIARYLTPSGKDINKKGFEPDYTINFTHSDFINDNDPQLAYAQKYLEKL